VTVIGALGATSKDAARLGALIPHGIAVALTTICTVLIAVSSLSDIGQTLHAVIAGLVVLFASVGINPTARSSRSRPRSGKPRATYLGRLPPPVRPGHEFSSRRLVALPARRGVSCAQTRRAR
jgi:hypothetical protein